MNMMIMMMWLAAWTGIASGRSPTSWVTRWAPESCTTWAGTSWSRYRTRTRCRGRRRRKSWTPRRMWRRANPPTASRRRRTPMLPQLPWKSSGSRLPCESRPRLWSKQFWKTTSSEHQRQTDQRYLAFKDEMARGLFHPHFRLSPLAPPHSSLSALSTIELEKASFHFFSFLLIFYISLYIIYIYIIWFDSPPPPTLLYLIFSVCLFLFHGFRREKLKMFLIFCYLSSPFFFLFQIHFLVINQRIIDDCFFFLLFLFLLLHLLVFPPSAGFLLVRFRVCRFFLISTWYSWNLLDHRPTRKLINLHTHTHPHTHTHK